MVFTNDEFEPDIFFEEFIIQPKKKEEIYDKKTQIQKE